MNKKIGILAAILLCFACFSVRANLITIAISGQVTSVSDSYGHFENKIHAGDTITGTYTYDSATPDMYPSDSSLAQYWHYAAPTGISLDIKGFKFRTNPSNPELLLEIINNDFIREDIYSIGSGQILPLSDGTLIDVINWYLNDSTGTALSSDALPLTAPDLSKWNSNILYITRDRDFRISATVTSVAFIPEPATLLLLFFGIAIIRRS